MADDDDPIVDPDYVLLDGHGQHPGWLCIDGGRTWLRADTVTGVQVIDRGGLGVDYEVIVGPTPDNFVLTTGPIFPTKEAAIVCTLRLIASLSGLDPEAIGKALDDQLTPS